MDSGQQEVLRRNSGTLRLAARNRRKIEIVKGAHCLIHAWKPDMCRNYPVTVGQALEFGCGGYDHLPQERLKQLIVIEFIQVLQQTISNDKININL